MNPEKSQRKSRRSSILKPPKPRQPFQNVELAVSSAENSPTTTTTKVKRRVSFAEKKHVKEFCDSMEQGTVWDNTYEESELSQMRNSENSSLTKSTSAENKKDSGSVERDINSGDSISDFAHTKKSGIPLPANHSGSFNARHPPSATRNAFRSSNKENPILLESSYSCSAEISTTISAIGLKKSANNVPPTMPDDECTNISMDETLIENISVEPTFPTPITLSKTTPILHTSFNVMKNIDFLKTDSETSKNMIDSVQLNDCQSKRSKAQDKILIYEDTSMAMSNRVSIISKHQQKILGDRKSNEESISVAEEETTFQIKTVDIVTKILGLSKTDFKELDKNEVDLRPESMPIFHNKLVKSQKADQNILITNQKLIAAKEIFDIENIGLKKVVQDVEISEDTEIMEAKQTTVFQDKSLGLPEAIQNDSSSCKLQKQSSEKTTIFHDKSVDFTGIVQNLPIIEKPQNMSHEQVALSHNKSMDFTEVVRSNDNDGNQQISSPQFLTKTTEFQDQSMHRAGVIQNCKSIKSPEKAASNKTMIFQNQPVDMTEVVGNHRSHEMQPSEKITIFHNQLVDMTEVVHSRQICEKPPSEKTAIFDDPNVDMTEVVRSRQICKNPSSEKTTIFHDQSVDVTEVLRDHRSHEMQPSDKTTIFHNHLVDMTEVVHSRQIYENPSSEKTTIFHDQNVDMTEVVRSRQICGNPSSEKTTIFHDQNVDMTEVVHSRQIYDKPLPEKTTVFHDESVDMTEVVRSRQICEKSTSEKTTIFHDQSVDVTEVVGDHRSHEMQPLDKTTIFNNQLVDMTEVVRSRKICENPSSEKTTIFHDQNVDMTEVVHSRQIYDKPLPEKTTVFHDESVDMTEVVHSRQICEKLPSEKTTIFHDQNVDMTEVVRSRQICGKPPSEKTTIFHDENVDMTEAVHSRQIYEKPSSEKITIFHNQLVDMTELVHSRQIHEKSPSEKTTIFHDQNVDMTEVVRSCQRPEKPPPEKITIFEHQSVDITEEVESLQHYKKPPPEKTTISPNSSVNVTEPVRNQQTYKKSDLARTKPFQNQDMIKVVQSNSTPTQKVLDPEIPLTSPQTTTILDNKSADHNNMESLNGNKPSENQNLELTEAISRIPSISTLLSRDSCTLGMERILKQKLLNSEEANELIACIDLKSSDPEVRSPATKRMKSLGNRQSLDLTAAVPFVVYRKLARHQSRDPKSTTCNPSSAQVHCGTTFTSEDFDNISTNVPEVSCGTKNVDSSRIFPIKSLEPAIEKASQGITNFQNRSMEMTEAIPSHNSLELKQQQEPNITICHDDSMEMTRAIPGILKVNAAINHDDSMEFTKAVSHNLIKENFTVLNENYGNFDTLPNSENKTMVFQDESMELTNGIHLSSKPVEKDGGIMVYHDDSMDFTRVVQSSLQVQAENKENCPPGPDYLQSRSSRRPGKNSNSGISKNEWLEMMESVPLESSQENSENKAGNVGKEIQNRYPAAEEITGIVPFSSSQESTEDEVEPIESEKRRLHTKSADITGVLAFGTKNSDGCTLKKVGSAIISEVNEGHLKITEEARWSSGLNLEKPAKVFDNTDCQSGLPLTDVFSSPDKTQHRHSQVAKELFQKSVPINRSKPSNENPIPTLETANLEEEMKNLAETLALSNSVDESGFDEATFLRQQARCMEDYEANSTATQESHSGTMSTKSNMSYNEKRDPPTKSISTKGTTTASQILALPTENQAISPDSKTANISIRNDSNFQWDGPSKMHREDYDRSLEELKCRAYSVSKFHPEVTGFELTGPVSMIDPGNLHKSIFDEEPPSFVLSDSVATDAINNCSAPGDVLTTDAPIGGQGIQEKMSLETRNLSLPDITECVKISGNDKPEVEINSIAKETNTLKGDNYSAGVLDDENVQLGGGRQCNRTLVIKRPSIEPTIFISSSTEPDAELQRKRLSGFTTSAEFSSQSIDGPHEKIQRRENESTIEKGILPIVDEGRNETELIEKNRFWGTKTFANSTIMGEDYTRQFIPSGVEKTSILLDGTSSNEVLSKIVDDDDDQMVNKEPDVEKGIEITMEVEECVPKSPYDVMKKTIESLAERPETIWKIKRLDEQIVAFTFFSRSLVVATYLNDNAIWNSTDPIEEICFLSQLKEDGSPPNMCLAHRMIMKKICSASLTNSYKTYDDIPRMLEYVTTEVKLGMDFMFELDRLSDRMIMDINGNSITFMVQTENINAGIILNITMEIKPFEEISPDDITIAHLLKQREISDNDIRRLITNVKRDHRFLRFYINDVKTYIELMAESGFSSKKKKTK